MPIIDTSTVKSILGITASTWDTQIGVLIPYVQDDILRYCTPDSFKDDNIYIQANTIAFVDSDPDTITDSGSGFLDASFAAEMDVYVEDSLYNDGLYNVDTVVAGTLTLDSTESVVTEAAGENILITRIKWPKGLLMIVAQIIWQNITRAQNKDVKSERIGDYSVTYTDLSSGGYSSYITSALNKYRRPRFV